MEFIKVAAQAAAEFQLEFRCGLDRHRHQFKKKMGWNREREPRMTIWTIWSVGEAEDGIARTLDEEFLFGKRVNRSENVGRGRRPITSGCRSSGAAVIAEAAANAGESPGQCQRCGIERPNSVAR